MKYPQGDYRNHGPLKSRPLTRNHLGARQGYPEPASGQNRHERRTAVHFGELRKNSLGVPFGFSVQTWNSRCSELADALRASDASKGKEYVSPGKQRRYARSTDIRKGCPGIKLARAMFRAQGVQETILLMHGYNRGVKKHPGYPTMGNYDKTGGYLASPRR